MKKHDGWVQWRAWVERGLLAFALVFVLLGGVLMLLAIIAGK